MVLSSEKFQINLTDKINNELNSRILFKTDYNLSSQHFSQPSMKMNSLSTINMILN